jgi:GT2 family glycosyltransferase
VAGAFLASTGEASYNRQGNTLTTSRETFTGFVDEAVVVLSTTGSKWLFLEGWILARDGPVKQLRFNIAQNSSQMTAEHVERLDVARQQLHLAHAKDSGFRVSLPLDVIQSVFTVEFCALLDTGAVIRSTINVRPTLCRPSYQHAIQLHEQGVSNSLQKRTRDSVAPDYRETFVTACKQRYRNFLLTGEQLVMPPPHAPSLSVIIPVARHEYLTYACLENLHAIGMPELEILVIDGSDSPETRELVARFPGVQRIVNRDKHTFSHSCNVGAQNAKSRNLLFLNNDAFPLPGALEAAVSCLKQNPHCGAIGAKLIRPDGRIQEAGSFILPTGTTVGLGRGTPPNEPMYNIALSVDYCSAAFLLTPKEIFSSLGGFDERFDPAYYEDADYCLRAAKAGHPCIVEPQAVVLHLERGTSENTYDVSSLMTHSLKVFQSIHPEFNQRTSGSTHSLNSSPKRSTVATKRFRTQRSKESAADFKHTSIKAPTTEKQSILVVDDSIPDPARGQGQGRSALILETLTSLDLDISWYAAHHQSGQPSTQATHKVTFVQPEKRQNSIDFLRQILPTVDTVLVSRSHHMEQIQVALRSLPALPKVPKIVYDAECLQGTRDILRFENTHNTILSNEEIETILSNEVIVARDADQILAVSPLDASAFVDFGFPAPIIVSHGITAQPTKASFDERSNFLTVGPMLEADTPNSDAVCWFMESIFPHIISLLHTSKVSLHCVGDCHVKEIVEMQSLYFKLLGRIRDMQPVYSSYRVMIAPTRFVAGIPLKVVEAAAYGVPCVVTPSIAQQLTWEDGVELLVGRDPLDFASKCAALYQDADLWQRIRNAALDRVAQQFSVSEFRTRLSAAIKLSPIHF